MTRISEKQVLTNISLNETQKMVLVKIKTAPTPKVAYENVARGEKTVVARDQLVELNLIEIADGTASLTDDGEQMMIDDGLVDDMGEVTDEAKKYIEMKTEGFALFDKINSMVKASDL